MSAEKTAGLKAKEEECLPRGQPCDAPKTLIYSFDAVSFTKHVLPYYSPCLAYIVMHLSYYYLKGNILPLILYAYIINFPYYNWNRRIPKQEFNLDRATEKIFQADDRFLGPMYAYILIDTLTWVWSLCVVSGVYPSFLPASLFEDKVTGTAGGYFMFLFLFGYQGGVNGLAGHELIHKKNAFDKFLGMTTYTKILYSHFLLEHGSGHHRNIATPEDSATARYGENLYTFMVRSAIGGHVNTWERETARLKIKYDTTTVSALTQLTENRMSWFAALHIALMAVILNVFGWRAFNYQVMYALFGVFFIELINYTEHYGLQRKKDARGIYEPINEYHSWNASSSFMLFKIQRHSDHHMHAYRPYQILKKIDNAPTMPYMYMYQLVLALCPPLWFNTMDQILYNKK